MAIARAALPKWALSRRLLLLQPEGDVALRGGSGPPSARAGAASRKRIDALHPWGTCFGYAAANRRDGLGPLPFFVYRQLG